MAMTTKMTMLMMMIVMIMSLKKRDLEKEKDKIMWDGKKIQKASKHFGGIIAIMDNETRVNWKTNIKVAQYIQNSECIAMVTVNFHVCQSKCPTVQLLSIPIYTNADKDTNTNTDKICRCVQCSYTECYTECDLSLNLFYQKENFI